MNELQTILAILERSARRMRLKRVLRTGFQGLMWGSAGALALALAYHCLPLSNAVLPLLAAIPLVGALSGICLGWRTPTLAAVARHLDQSAHLQERLSTAVELANAPASDSWRTLVLTDAAARVQSLDASQLIPIRLPATSRWSLLLLTLCACTTLLPVYRSPAQLQRQADAALVRNTGRQLAELTRHSLEARPPALEPVRKSLESIAKIGAALEHQALTRAEALQELTSLSDKLQEQARALGANPAVQRLEKAARSADGAPGATPTEMQQRLEALRQQAGAAASDKLDSLRSRLEQLQKQAQAASQGNAAEKASQNQALSDALASLARDAQEMGIQTEALDSAIAALAANRPDRFVKDLQAAMTDLDKLRQMSTAMKQLQNQMEKLGKDLAEQLEAGQATAAQSTLQEMARQLQAANLSPEQLKKLLQDVQQAIKPGCEYGSVGECLRKAAQQLQAGQKGAAAGSLAQAAKELANLKQQFDDLQQMAAAIENMDYAGSCLSTGSRWAAVRRPGAGSGQRVGAGVGTWAADGLQDWAPESGQRWDNSGVQRPDLAPRGHSDREAGSTEGFTPDRVKGQISQGAPMPSIALKGLSIRGQSRVTLEQATSTAQQEAQAALSQERVPRAYQAPVRDYFDDLKK